VKPQHDDDVGETAYLDLCCFDCSFDDATIERIRPEAEPVAAILDMAQAGTFHLVRSPAHDFENGGIRVKTGDSPLGCGWKLLPSPS
jgi:hypothetical protein